MLSHLGEPGNDKNGSGKEVDFTPSKPMVQAGNYIILTRNGYPIDYNHTIPLYTHCLRSIKYNCSKSRRN